MTPDGNLNSNPDCGSWRRRLGIPPLFLVGSTHKIPIDGSPWASGGLERTWRVRFRLMFGCQTSSMKENQPPLWLFCILSSCPKFSYSGFSDRNPCWSLSTLPWSLPWNLPFARLFAMLVQHLKEFWLSDRFKTSLPFICGMPEPPSPDKLCRVTDLQRIPHHPPPLRIWRCKEGVESSK